MAIQNFLSGGFYGKLGDVVGQRWHNKRTVRTYVIPFNPRTELQQNNRALFAIATRLAQQAYQINRGSQLWDTSQMGQFSAMVGTAKRRLQAGKSPAESLPLYPDGYFPSVVLSSPSASWSLWSPTLTVSDNSYTFIASRQFAIEIHCKDEFRDETVFLTRQVTVPQGSVFSFTFNNGNRYSLPSGSSIQAISTDDALFGGSSITLPVFSLTQPSLPTIQVPISFSAPVYDPVDNALYFSVSCGEFSRYFEPIAEVYYFYPPYSEWDTLNNAFILNGDGPSFFGLEIEFSNMFPSGSRIIGGYYSEGVETAILRVTWGDLPFQYP